MVNLAEKIKLLRRQKNLTQEHLAETFGVSCQAISKWETASSFPDISLLPVIADYFGVSIDIQKTIQNFKTVRKDGYL